MDKTVRININRESYELELEPNQTLLDLLREQLGMTGTKKGCEIGACGACTVIIDGEPALSCMTLALRCRGKEVITIEGMAENGRLHPLQEMAIEHGAVQCGYCTPGWLLSAKVLLDNNPSPTLDEVRSAISGNICRCTGYQKIEESILAAAGRSLPAPAPEGESSPRV
ncbi:MAG: (2Fe-2S)-binding protein [Acidobacteria bacterium]|nr:(2Fe-2S)-binding protein [Acidobacteriota bacterium]